VPSNLQVLYLSYQNVCHDIWSPDVGYNNNNNTAFSASFVLTLMVFQSYMPLLIHCTNVSRFELNDD